MSEKEIAFNYKNNQSTMPHRNKHKYTKHWRFANYIWDFERRRGDALRTRHLFPCPLVAAVGLSSVFLLSLAKLTMLRDRFFSSSSDVSGRGGYAPWLFPLPPFRLGCARSCQGEGACGGGTNTSHQLILLE